MPRSSGGAIYAHNRSSARNGTTQVVRTVLCSERDGREWSGRAWTAILCLLMSEHATHQPELDLGDVHIPKVTPQGSVSRPIPEMKATTPPISSWFVYTDHPPTSSAAMIWS
jgi:hypothetical protein